MILVLLSTGDRAEADDPAAAVLAARTLMDDAREAGCSGLTASFYAGHVGRQGEPHGYRLVRAGVTRSALASVLPGKVAS